MKRVTASAKVVAKWLAAEFDADTVGVLIALLLIGIGFWHLWRPGAFIVPGLVVLWFALPSRPPFITREIDPADARRKR